jgi:hypothetical protein
MPESKPTESQPTADKPSEKKASPHTKVYEDVGAFLEALQAERGHTWPLTDEQLRAFVGDVAWVKVVNHERAEHDQEPLERHEALSVRPKLFDKSWAK